MAGEHYLELRNFSTGARLGIITGATGSGSSARNGFRRLIVQKEVNAPGTIIAEIPADHPLLPLTDKTLVLDWRRDTARGIAWYLHHAAVFRDEEYQSQHGERDVTLKCPGLLSLLDWYYVLWAAGVANRTVFTAAKGETIMKTLVKYNADSSNATAANGRDRNAASYGIALEADGANGNTIDWTANRSHTLLSELQALALVAGGDFDLEYTSSTVRTFRWYTGQRGTDKSASILFAENLGNMDNVTLRRSRASERTAAVVGGGGEKDDRDIVLRTGTNYNVTTNNIELFVDARDIAKGVTAALQSRGDQKLSETMARDAFGFDVLQTDGTYYGPSGAGSYELGDLVSARRPDGVTVTQQVYGVNISWNKDGKEQIAVEVITK
jgi:hypothetical protein